MDKCRVNVGYNPIIIFPFINRFILLAMVNKTVFSMKQPDLGQKILQWRKSKGLTQEELVEKCNLNVRTLQRIEAGEVLPRSYTIKSILSALEVDFSVLQEEKKKSENLSTLVKPYRSLLIIASIMGLLYLVLSTLEAFMDLAYYNNSSDEVNFLSYSLVKVGVILSFGFFYYGFFIIGKAIKDQLIVISSIFLIGLLTISNSNDLISLQYDYVTDDQLIIIKSIVFGIAYLFMGIALSLAYKKLGNLVLATGIIGIFSGLGLLTVILAIPALISLTLFEILLLVIVVRSLAHSNSGTEESNISFSTV